MPATEGPPKGPPGSPQLYAAGLEALGQLPEPKTPEQYYLWALGRQMTRLETIFLSMDHSLRVISDYFINTITGGIWSSVEQIPASNESPLDIDFAKAEKVLFSLVIVNLGPDPIRFRIPRSGPWTTVAAGVSLPIFFQTPLIRSIQLQSTTQAQCAVSLLGQY